MKKHVLAERTLVCLDAKTGKSRLADPLKDQGVSLLGAAGSEIALELAQELGLIKSEAEPVKAEAVENEKKPKAGKK